MKPIAMVLADMHIREDQPLCWTTSYWTAQYEAVEFISFMQKEHDCPVFVAGDIFDKWNPSYELFTWAMDHFPKDMYVVAGQHDLKHHNIKNFHKTGLNALNKANAVYVLADTSERVRGRSGALMDIYGYPFGKEIKPPEKIADGAIENIALCHELTYKRRLPFIGCSADNATRILKRMKKFDLVCTGDNHQSFTTKYKDRLLINAGSMLPMTADQHEYQPRLFLWYGGTEYETIDIPIPKDCISRKHIERKAEKDKKMEVFISKLGDGSDFTLDFKKNIKKAIDINDIKKSVQKVIWEVIND